MPTSRQLRQKYSFHDLTHERRFIPPESLERSIVEIGEALETERQVAGRAHDKPVRTARPVVRIGFGMIRVAVAATFLAVRPRPCGSDVGDSMRKMAETKDD